MATAMTADIKRDILVEAGALDCLIVDLLAGCFGDYGYMQESYGITIERCRLTMRTVNELPAFVKEEHGVDITVKDVIATLRAANDKMEEAFDRLTGY